MGSNWEEMQQWLARQQLPKGFDMLKEADWIGKMVQQVMTSTMKDQKTQEGSAQQNQFKENKQYLWVTITVPSSVDPEDLRLLIREDRIKLETPHDSKVVKLPKPVIPNRCQAAYRNGVLRVKLRKRAVKRSYIEVPFHYIDSFHEPKLFR